MLTADLSDSAVAAQAGQHDLQLLLRRPARYFLCSLNLVSLSVERPILSPDPDSLSAASPLRRLAGEPKDSSCQRRSGERGTSKVVRRPLGAGAEA